MPLSRSARLLYYRCTLALAWVAMCLLFAGPLISQLQASQHDHGHHGHSHQVHLHGHSASAAPHDHAVSRPNTASSQPFSSTLSDWHNQCGYCELWQHSPSLSIALPAIVHNAWVALGGIFLAPDTGALFQFNYPYSLTRGPPNFNAGHLKDDAQATFIVTRQRKKETGLLGFFKA